VFHVLERLAVPWTDALVVLNREDFDSALEWNAFASNRLLLCPGVGLDLRAFDRRGIDGSKIARMRAVLGMEQSTPLFIVVAEFQKGKRQEDALRALALLDRPEARMAFAGEGPQLPAARQLALDLGLADRVHFLGFLDDIRPLVACATALVLPSVREGLPVCVMEAMALETPVIGTDVRGTRDLLQGECGILVPPRTPSALASALEESISDPLRMRRLAEAARLRVNEYSLDRVMTIHRELYASLLPEGVSP
jgi:glycosyltransferase involved in cell wall biosynthesis